MQKLLFFISLLLLTSCFPKQSFEQIGGTIVTCKYPDMKEKGENPEFILSILKDRVNRIDGSINSQITYNETDSTFSIEVPGIKDDLVNLLFSHGEISISETMKHKSNKEFLYSKNNSIDSLIFKYNKVIYPNITHILLYNVSTNDTSAVRNIINLPEFQSQLTKNTKLYWSYPDNQRKARIDLYLLTLSKYKINIKEVLKKASIAKGYDDSLEIHLQLNDIGAESFYNLTTKNIGYSLAITCDEFVISAPTVLQPIERGSVIISGYSDKEVIRILDILLNTNTIQSDVVFINKEKRDPVE